MGLWGAGWVKNLSVGIRDGAPSTAHSSNSFDLFSVFLRTIDHFNTKCPYLIGKIKIFKALSSGVSKF